ncbi:hypothetical protein ONZ51_g8065 [Trametes cubensis]|uniref:Peptidase A1 domain-containing protein n=1 Tax=Trametes cubensis TaxID=1111947 RepID=A0AAD7TPA7_9APHY|nr:hypothetical protein ONZ51_g8065 [Trametes cubensis]
MLLSSLTQCALLLFAGLVSVRAATPNALAHTPRAAPSSPYPVAVSHSGDSGGFGFTNSRGHRRYWELRHVDRPAVCGCLPTPEPHTYWLQLDHHHTANVTFGPYTVHNQAITLSFNSSVDAGKPVNGLIGLGGYIQDGSTIYTSLANTSFAENGVSIIFNIFEHLPELPNYMTFLMSRSSGGLTDGGLLTVSEVLSNLTDILKAPLLNSLSDELWETTLDGVYLNGKLVLGGVQQGNLSEASGPAWNRSAILDTGTTRITAPLSDVQEFYKNVPGASPITMGDSVIMYRVPCDTKLNVTFSLSGQQFPLHPIDMVQPGFNGLHDGFICVGNIYYGNDFPAWILGDSFLHNVYTLYGYGVPGSGELKAQTLYMQLLSLTDPDQAWKEFESLLFDELLYSANSLVSLIAGNATSTTGLAVYTGTSPSLSLVEASVTATATSQPTASEFVDASDNSATIAGAIAEDGATPSTLGKMDLSGLLRNSYIILGLLTVVLVLLLVSVALIVKASRANVGYRSVPTASFAGRDKVYVPDVASHYSTSYADGGHQ